MRPLFWDEHALDEVRSFPEEVRREVGGALREAQDGRLSPLAKPFIRHKGHQVYEIVSDDADRNATYRVMYLVDLPDGLYALHAFQKKSKKGIATPRREVELVKKRVDRAVAASRERMQKNG